LPLHHTPWTEWRQNVGSDWPRTSIKESRGRVLASLARKVAFVCSMQRYPERLCPATEPAAREPDGIPSNCIETQLERPQGEAEGGGERIGSESEAGEFRLKATKKGEREKTARYSRAERKRGRERRQKGNGSRSTEHPVETQMEGGTLAPPDKCGTRDGGLGQTQAGGRRG
jgi:hypothetical protein